MEFLKTIYGDKSLTYDELVNALNAYNGDEANKDKQIKIGNLGGGEYVGRGKYDGEIEKLNNLLAGKTNELETANQLIADLKKGTKGNEDLQSKITGYEAQVQQLQAQLNETKIKSAVKVELLSEKALDIDYLTYKLNEKMREKGMALELDENDKIKGWDDILSDLKTQLPQHFGSANNLQIEANPLPESQERSGITKEQFDRMGYQNRLKLKQESPDVYAQMTGKND